VAVRREAGETRKSAGSLIVRALRRSPFVGEYVKTGNVKREKVLPGMHVLSHDNGKNG
jgi:hypothetical protein